MSIIMVKDGSVFNFIKIRNVKISNDVLTAQIQIKKQGKYVDIAIPLKSITNYNDIDFNKFKNYAGVKN